DRGVGGNGGGRPRRRRRIDPDLGRCRRRCRPARHHYGRRRRNPECDADNALISLGVSTRQSTAVEAMNAANTEMTALLKAIKGQGVLDVDLQTPGLSVYQDQQYNVIGYR